MLPGGCCKMINLKERWLAWRERRFLKKHHCVSREQYEHTYDKDVNFYAGRISEYYRGYPFIYAFESSHLTPFDQFGDWLEGLYALRKWCGENCKAKWRADILRVNKRWDIEDDGWIMDELGGGDVLFFAFKSEEDMLWFSLRWA